MRIFGVGLLEFLIILFFVAVLIPAFVLVVRPNPKRQTHERTLSSNQNNQNSVSQGNENFDKGRFLFTTEPTGCLV